MAYCSLHGYSTQRILIFCVSSFLLVHYNSSLIDIQLFLGYEIFVSLICLMQGQDGVDLEMNLNGGRSRMEDDDLDDMVFNEHQMAKLKKSEAFTVEREREIQQVVESVNELAQIMKDLSVLVIDQGTIVDRIDYNIQNVATTVDEGLKQLQKVLVLFSKLFLLSLAFFICFSDSYSSMLGLQAERTQKKGGMVMCATVLVIMCFVMLVLLILKEIIF